MKKQHQCKKQKLKGDQATSAQVSPPSEQAYPPSEQTYPPSELQASPPSPPTSLCL